MYSKNYVAKTYEACCTSEKKYTRENLESLVYFNRIKSKIDSKMQGEPYGQGKEPRGQGKEPCGQGIFKSQNWVMISLSNWVLLPTFPDFDRDNGFLYRFEEACSIWNVLGMCDNLEHGNVGQGSNCETSYLALPIHCFGRSRRDSFYYLQES